MVCCHSGWVKIVILLRLRIDAMSARSESGDNPSIVRGTPVTSI